jgi:hypothetical protein
VKDKIILADGSVQGIVEIPQDIRNRYKTVWELKQKGFCGFLLSNSEPKYLY